MPTLYKRLGNKLKGDNSTLLISQRTSPTPQKSALFLVQKEPQERYISSLYPYKEANTSTTFKESYKFDFSGIKYVLRLSDKEAEIERLV
jgi:hypothetical protein